jgi:hypothetical protein
MTHWDGKIVVPTKEDLVIFTDVSDSGWGAALDQKSVRGFWTPSMKEESINYKELMVVFLALLSFKDLVKKKLVLI